MGCKFYGRAGKHHESLGTAGERHIDSCICDSAIGAAYDLLGIEAKYQGKFFRQNVRGKHLRNRRRRNVSHALEIGVVVSLSPPQVIGDRSANAVMIPSQKIDTETIAGTEESNITILNVDDWAALHLVSAGARVNRLRVGGGSQDDSPFGQIGLEQPSQNHAPGILPFLQRRRRLRHCVTRAKDAKEDHCARRQPAEHQPHDTSRFFVRVARRPAKSLLGFLVPGLDRIARARADLSFEGVGGGGGDWGAALSAGNPTSGNRTSGNRTSGDRTSPASCLSASSQSCSAVPSGQPRACESR